MSGRFIIVVASALMLSASARAADDPEVFGPDKVWQFHLALTAEEFAAMQPPAIGGFGFQGPQPPKAEPKPGERETHRGAFGTEFPWAVASFTADGKTLEKVGLRYKGNSTYMMSSRGLKRSLKVDLDRFDEKGRFRGMKSLTLDSGVFDPSKCREALSYAIYRAAGVPAPRTAFAEVTLTVPGKFDKEHVGLYTLIEDVDKSFAKAHFKNGTGLIMKPERIPGIVHLGDDWNRYKDTYRPKRDATKDESRRVIDFTRLISNAPDKQFEEEIASYLDVDAFFRLLAATAVIANLDNLANGHNYCLYLHPDTKKFHFVPWDLDLALGGFPFLGQAEQMDLSLVKPYFGQCRIFERLLANKERADRYQQILKEVVPLCFAQEKVLSQIAAFEKVVKPLIEKEAKAAAARREAAAGFGAPGGGAPDLKRFVEKRSESIAAQLAGKSKGFSPTNFAMGGPPPGGPQPGMGRPNPGEVIPTPLQNALQMTDEQKKRLAELQKTVDAELEKILTPQQRATLKQIREGGMGRPPGGFPPKQ